MKKIPDDLKSLEERINKQRAVEKAARKDRPESEFAYATKTGFRAYWSGPLWATFWTNCSTRSPFCSLFACFSAVPRDS